MIPIGPDPRALHAHPDTPCPWVEALDVSPAIGSGPVLRLEYRLRGEPGRIRIPASQATGRADGLWRRTCFEAFLAVEGTPGYWELNLSPSGHWQVYRFCGYRAGGREAEVDPPDIAVTRQPDGLSLTGRIRLPELPAVGRLKVGLCAVVEDGDGGLSYWALRHPPGRPDFHHPDAFALLVDLAGDPPGRTRPA